VDVKDDYVEQFAGLCAAVAERYKDVEYFQVWNEMKGYWSSSLNNWDYIRYTTLYNAVYEAVKAERPDAKVGGPYLVIQGDGAVELGKSGRDTFSPIGSRDWDVIDYWLENKKGADFFCFDYGLIDYHDTNTYTNSEKMKLTKNFGRILAQLGEKTDLPIFISEFYGGSDEIDRQFTAANHASCYYHAILNNASLALVWNPQEGEIDNFLFTQTERSDGGQPSAHYSVVKAINDHFSKGTQLYHVTSSSDDIDVLSSAEKTLLINKTENSLAVDVDGEIVQLDRYEVRIIDTPAQTRIGDDRLPNSPDIKVIYSTSGPALQILAPFSTDIDMHVFDVLGRKVEDYHHELSARSLNTIKVFRDSAQFSSGIYFVHLRGSGINTVKRCYWVR
jgi:hypothetical protein